MIAAVASESDATSPGGEDGQPETADRPRPDPVETWLTIEQLAERSGIPLAVLEAVVLVPHRVHGQNRYSSADLAAAGAGLQLLEQGLPLPELLELARMHTNAMRATAERAVQLFDRYVRQAMRTEGVSEAVAGERLMAAFEAVLPATLTMVSHHFHRTLLAVAQEHIERVANDGERDLVTAAAKRAL